MFWVRAAAWKARAASAACSTAYGPLAAADYHADGNGNVILLIDVEQQAWRTRPLAALP